MSKSSRNGKPKKVCFNCDISDIIGSITKRSITDKQLAAYFQETYENYAKKHDDVGRTALHVAASCGRSELCQWLIAVAGANINGRDLESGYTPLQRATFHGHVYSAVRLLQMGADPLVVDKEGLTALDIIVKDRPKQIEVSSRVPCQVYIWGSNDNYTLGTGTDKSRKLPDLLDNFKTKNVSIKQVCLNEYHSVFVSSCSRVWVCGNGQGGRLGVSTESHILTPRAVSLRGEQCLMAAASSNHTLLLLANKTVLAFGQNDHYQLGVSPYKKECLHPKAVSFPQPEELVGICAGRYHSIFYGKITLFTCGLNGGQLGHPHLINSPYIKTPTQVPVNLKSGSFITHVASSTACTVFSLSSGEIYTLNQFQFNKIASKQLDVCQIGTCGGTIQSKAVNESYGVLKVVLLNSGGTIQIWQETNPHLKKCMFGLSRLISISYIFLTESKILFTTRDGEAFQGTIGQITKQTVNSSQEEKSGFHKFIEKSECYHISSHRIPNIHRAVSITSDPKGKNMAVLQFHPINALTDLPKQSYENLPNQLLTLLEDSSEVDIIHDVLFKVKQDFFPAHEYIIASNTSTLLSLPKQGKVIEINDIQPDIFKEILIYMYSGWCSLLNEGPVSLRLSSLGDDPVRLLTEASHNYKLTSLYKKITCFRYVNGSISLKDSSDMPTRDGLSLKRDLFPELHDVDISSEDGKLLKAHKCILVARVDYFRSMLMGGWIEAVSTPVLHLECPATTLEMFLEFLYTNEVPKSLHNESFETLGRLLILSDQLLCNEIKEFCEISLVYTLNLKNAANMLQLSFIYNTSQLKQTVMQFISLNLATLIENRSLEGLTDEMLLELDKYHRSFNADIFDRRIITPYFQTLPEELILSAPEISWPENLAISYVQLKEEKAQEKSVLLVSKRRSHGKKSLEGGGEGETRKEGMPDSGALTKEGRPNDGALTKEGTVSGALTKEGSPPLTVPSSPPETFLHPTDFPPILDKDFQQKSRSKIRKPFNLCKKIKEQKEEKLKICEPIESISPKSQFKGWAIISPPNSVETCGSNELPSRPQVSSFVEILASEEQAKQDYFKMKGKSFILTQMEDKAMEDLCEFYNTVNIFDERISVHRVTTLNIPKPTWIKNNKTLFH